MPATKIYTYSLLTNLGNIKMDKIYGCCERRIAYQLVCANCSHVEDKSEMYNHYAHTPNLPYGEKRTCNKCGFKSAVVSESSLMCLLSEPERERQKQVIKEAIKKFKSIRDRSE